MAHLEGEQCLSGQWWGSVRELDVLFHTRGSRRGFSHTAIVYNVAVSRSFVIMETGGGGVWKNAIRSQPAERNEAGPMVAPS